MQDITAFMLDQSNEDFEMIARCMHILSSKDEIKGDLAAEVFEELEPIDI